MKIKILSIAAIALCLAACANGQLTPAGQTAVNVACIVDETLDPVVVALAPELAPLAAGDKLLHPAVVSACQAVSGKPSSVTVTTTATAPAPASPSATVAPTQAPATPVAGQ